MIAQLGNQQAVAIHLVDHSMFFVDPPRPEAGKGVPERLRFAGPFEWGPAGFLDQDMDALEQLSIGGLPMEVVLSGLFREDQSHSARTWSWPRPASRLSTASISRRALRGERSR